MSKFYVIATPIGNLGDITFRAIEHWKMSIWFCAKIPEWRKSFWINTISTSRRWATMLRVNFQKLIKFLNYWKRGKIWHSSQMPVRRDFWSGRFARFADKNHFGDEVEVIPIPGASALITALSASGLPTHEFTFLGFLPHKKGRETLLKK